LAVTEDSLQGMADSQLLSLRRVSGPETVKRINSEFRRRSRVAKKKRERASPVPKQTPSDLKRVRSIAIACGGTSPYAVEIPYETPVKRRPRFGKGRVYKDKKSRYAQKKLKTYLDPLIEEPRVGALCVVCIFYRETRHVVDGDNLLKFVMDAANGILWHDDNQVTAKVAIIEHDKENPRTVMAVSRHYTTMERNGKGWK